MNKYIKPISHELDRQNYYHIHGSLYNRFYHIFYSCSMPEINVHINISFGEMNLEIEDMALAETKIKEALSYALLTPIAEHRNFLTLDFIMNHVVKYTGIAAEKIKSPSREGAVYTARALFIRTAFRYSDASERDIADYVSKNRSSIGVCRRTFEDDINTSVRLKSWVNRFDEEIRRITINGHRS